MQIPSLPTDNLYKFLPIAGLVIIVLSVIGPWSSYEQLTSKNIEIKIQEYIYEKKRASIELEFKEIEGQEKKTKKQEELELLKSRLGKLHEQLRQLEITSPEIAGRRVLYKDSVETTVKFIMVGICGLVLGVTLSIIGLFFGIKESSVIRMQF